MIFWILIACILFVALIGYLAINKTNTPYEHWRRLDFMDHFERHDSVMNLSPSMKAFFSHMVSSGLWSPHLDYNGCSIVQDKFHPCPDCFTHDFLWFTGQGGYLADRLFKKLMIASGMKKSRAWWRWCLVRIGWIFFYKWKNFFNRNVEPLSPEFIGIIRELQLSKKFD